MDIVFLQDTHLRAGSALCRYGAAISYIVTFLSSNSYPWKKDRALNCSVSTLCCLYYYVEC